MTTIRPLTGGINLEVRHIDDGGHALINVGPLPKPTGGGYVSEQSARYPVAGILEALDATANADAEAKLLEQYRRADKAEADHETTKKAYRDLGASHAKLLEQRDALAATVERVRHLRSVSGDTIGVEELDAALDPKPAFVLPTEVPARIEAKRDVLGYIDTLTLWTNGARQFWRSEYNGEDWKPKGVMECFTDHRLLDGAE